MTIIRDIDSTCALCGTRSAFPSLCSTNAIGAVDLDLRPPPMQRDTMNTWVQRCPGCGYCAADIKDREGIEPDWVRWTAYRALLDDTSVPTLAASFRASAWLADRRREPDLAFRHELAAAWVCDDAGKADAAVESRRRALDRLDTLQASHAGQDDWPEEGDVMRLDLLRRSGRFDAVTEAAAAIQTQDPTLARIIAFQIERARLGDTACYTIAALEPAA